ncbi:SURF1 family protein [soil metagenome]
MLARTPDSAAARRRTRIVVTVAAALFVLATVLLGNWQTRRAEQREAAFETARQANRSSVIELGVAGNDGDTVIGRRVAATGELVGAATVYLDNRQREGQTGFEVLTPLKLADGRAVMVNRGFMAVRPEGREVIVAPPLPATPARLEGMAVTRLGRALELGHVTHALGGIWSNFSAEEFERLSGLKLLPLVVEQTSDSGDGLIRRWPEPGAGSQQNRSYALQWYSMATLALAGWLWFMLAPLVRQRLSQRSVR